MRQKEMIRQPAVANAVERATLPSGTAHHRVACEVDVGTAMRDMFIGVIGGSFVLDGRDVEVEGRNGRHRHIPHNVPVLPRGWPDANLLHSCGSLRRQCAMRARKAKPTGAGGASTATHACLKWLPASRSSGESVDIQHVVRPPCSHTSLCIPWKRLGKSWPVQKVEGDGQTLGR